MAARYTTNTIGSTRMSTFLIKAFSLAVGLLRLPVEMVVLSECLSSANPETNEEPVSQEYGRQYGVSIPGVYTCLASRSCL